MQQEMDEEQSGIDPDRETFEEMVAGLTEHIFGPAESDMIAMLRNSKNVAADIGGAVLALVQSAADQAGEAGRDFDMDMLIGVATELIDSLLQMAESVGVIESAEDDTLRKEALFTAIQGYIAQLRPGSEEQEAAKQILQGMVDDGTFSEAEAFISEMGSAGGFDPFADDAGVDQPESPQQPAVQQGGQRRLMMG